MSRMEFLRENQYNTTTSVVVNNNTDGVEFLFDKNPTIQYTTSGYTGSTTASAISIVFSVPTVISHAILQNHNIRDWRIYYNSITSNSLNITSGNSASYTYLSFPSITVSSIQFEHISGQSNSERTIGELIFTDRLSQFERNPSINDFTPVIDRKQIIHEMPDGGIVLYNIKNKYRASLSWDFITSSFHSTLFNIYDMAQPVIFIPEPTTTAWNGTANEVVWIGDFDFKHSTNDKNQGYSGKINLRQTPSR